MIQRKKFKKIKKVESVREYASVFERNLTRVNLSQENVISYFTGHLKPELNNVVKTTNSTSLSQVYRNARMQEANLKCCETASIYSISNKCKKVHGSKE